jgi:glutathione S-transferase
MSHECHNRTHAPQQSSRCSFDILIEVARTPDDDDPNREQDGDRIFDNYVMTPMNWIVQDARRPPEARDAQSVAQGRALLDTTYHWLNQRMADRVWASGETFSMADCAAAPSLFYADWAHPISEEFSDLRAYRNRLLARQSFARAVGEA